MIQNHLKKIFGSSNDRYLKSIQPLVQKINLLEASVQSLTDTELQAKTPAFRERVARGESLDSLLPEAFAVVREASKRVLGQRHYDVQLIGGITLHRGRIAEMKTGEGKTLTATAPIYLNALSGKGTHLVTVNDYLAKRDRDHMGQLYGFLGLSTGVIVHGLTDRQRKEAYGSDITYGTNNEFGFDYLRDNMKFRLEDYVQREMNFAIVDEVDSILIDEARTPLIISGPSESSSELYYKIDKHILQEGGLLRDVDYTVDEKTKSSALTESGMDKMERRMGISNLYDPKNIEILHHVNQALRAHVLYHRDVEYVVRDGEVMIVDEFTGRLMPGRRWSDGLHQAIEAKEGVDIESENQTLATITFQNYFRMYNKLSGMTGTADTEATEFKQIYNLDVAIIPTNKKMIRSDFPDLIYKSQKGKFRSVADEIKKIREKGQPVLVGTVSVEKSELLHELLKKEGISHSVLNAKQHEREAFVIAQAGRKGAVTISTNMAGRGTDILLGGHPDLLALDEVGKLPGSATDEEKKEWEQKYTTAKEKWRERCAEEKKEVIAAGGLFILGTERHESRRIDNQLRGRSGRQGDPGESRFYLSFDDDLLRIFGHSTLLQRTVAAMEEDVPVEHSLTTKAIENAQRKVEGHNYDIRKHLLEYDDVMNQQRKVVYGLRKEVLSGTDLQEIYFSMVKELSDQIAGTFFPNGRLPRGADGTARLDIEALNQTLQTLFNQENLIQEADIIPFSDEGLKKWIYEFETSRFLRNTEKFGAENVHHITKMILLSTIDQLWKDHLLAMDHLREGIGLQGYGQKDPLVSYKKEGFRYFQMMMDQIYGDVVRKQASVQVTQSDFQEEYEAEIERKSREQEQLLSEEKNLSTAGIPTRAGVLTAGLQAGSGQMAPNSATAVDMRISASGGGSGGRGAVSAPTVRPVTAAVQVGRNDPCPCGSGKKYKKCHGA